MSGTRMLWAITTAQACSGAPATSSAARMPGPIAMAAAAHITWGRR